MSIAMLALLAAAFWLMVMRPAKRRQAAQKQLVSELKIGQRVMTTAGMFGYIRELTDDEVGLEISDGVVVRLLKPAIAQSAEVKDTATAAEPAAVDPSADSDSGLSPSEAAEHENDDTVDVSHPK